MGMRAFVVRIPGKPTAKGRGRFVRLPNGAVSTHTPAATRTYENHVRACALDAMAEYAKTPHQEVPAFPFDFPLALVMHVELGKPKKPRFGEYPATRPDLDNYLKAVVDGLGLAEVFTDDSRIVSIRCYKNFTLRPPGVQVWLRCAG